MSQTINDPKADPMIEHRSERPYIGIRAVMPMGEFPERIPALTAEVSHWLAARHLNPAGPPFLRYHVIDMPKRMDVELGIPVDGAPNGEPPVAAHSLPAGRYAVLNYRGVKAGLAANKRLIAWIAEQGEDTVHHASPNGDVFAARCETFLTDPAVEPDQNRWDTEIAIKLRG